MKNISTIDVEEPFDNMKRCTKCILPETFPGIEFDENGVCNYCLDYEPVKVYGEEVFVKVLDKYMGKGKKYDCVVPISGGRDSTFVLHQMMIKYKMRVLGLSVDSGAITPEGCRNIERATEILNVDHVWIRDENQIKIAKKNTKMKFHAWLQKPSIHTIIPTLNAGDKTMNLRIYKYAEKNRVPLILGGNNVGNSSLEQEHFKTGFLGVFPDERGMYSTCDKIKLSFLFALEFLTNHRNFHLSVFKEYVEGAYVYFFESLLRPKGATPLGFYDYIYWSEKEVVSTICNELDWQGCGDTSATWRIDDAAYPLIDYMYLKLVGFNEFDEFYSKMIREGQMPRDEALKRCLSENAPRFPSLMRAFEELKVTKEDVDEVLDKYRVKLLSKILNRK